MSKTITTSDNASSATSLADGLAAQVRELCADDWGRSPAHIGEAAGPAQAIALATVALTIGGPMLCILPSPSHRDSILMDLEVFAPEIEIVDLPAEELRTEAGASNLSDWMPALNALTTLDPTRPTIVCAVVSSLVTPLPDDKAFRKSALTLKVGSKEYKPERLADMLDRNGFEAVAQVESPGQFARRGGVFDLWPHAEEEPIRIEYFGNEIEELRHFDNASQRSLEKHKSISFPLMAPDQDALTKMSGGLLTYLPAGTLPIFIERRETLMRLDALRPFMRGVGKNARIEAIEEVTNAERRVEITEAPVMDRRGARNLGTLPWAARAGGAEAAVEATLELQEHVSRIEIHSGSEGESKRLGEVFDASKIESKGLSLYGTEISASITLKGGAIVSGADLLGKQRLRRGLTGDEISFVNTPHRAIDDFVRLETGDHVVHVNHGIARFLGMEELRTPEGNTGEYLRLEFAEGTEIHVPVTNADLVQKYIGTKGVAPRLTKFQSKRWSEKKSMAQAAILKLAADMLRVQALRKLETGVAYPPANEMLHDFVESFPFRDTPDQEQAWVDVQSDMEAPRPMDRLLCGDVGFGKTEIAMRAACKAVLHGKQVAILVPTTVLCQQHAMSFVERMVGFPVIVESISRFKSKKEQKQILKRVGEGKVDILIGTHRIVSKDVHFRDLGLLVIDEEQKFGVETKDALKKLRETVDVLTMTATPIPRTLHMSLLGIRDISSLTTPPQHRKAVSTTLHKWNDNFIQEKVRYELQRDGQIFFVHNRVIDIKDIAARIATLVPEARVGIGHGQMSENELEDVMLEFIDQKLDVLVCTTIIESGIDVQTANTIFINLAQNHGLANLHQLRGRVGRFRHNAYCYLLIPNEMNLKEVAEKRLRAILEHTKLGSGFFIAMRDLEIRGAGNIIGKEQSGFISSIGYDLYCQMLEHAIRQLQGGSIISEVDTSLNLDLSTVLPRKWVEGEENRAEVYRLIARCASPEHVDQVREELEDRYGTIPKDVEDLFMMAVVRHRLGQLGITSVTVGQMMENRPRHFRFKAVSAPASAGRIREVQPAIRTLDETTLVMPLHKGLEHPKDQLRYLWNLLQMMARKGIVKSAAPAADMGNEKTSG